MIRHYEELAMNAWPSLQTVAYDGWMLRFADGFSKRANSVQPLYPGRLGLADKIGFCETVYGGKGLDTVFKMTDGSLPDGLDGELERRGYIRTDTVSVMARGLDGLAEREPRHGDFRLSTALTNEWLDRICVLLPAQTKHRETIRAMFGRPVLDCGFAELRRDGKSAACGLAVVQGGSAGLFDIVTAAEFRRQGCAESIMRHLLHWARGKGAEEAYLQVLCDNEAACRLYAKLGFTERYKQWYRIFRPGNHRINAVKN